jgi:hypothetical protein
MADKSLLSLREWLEAFWAGREAAWRVVVECGAKSARGAVARAVGTTPEEMCSLPVGYCGAGKHVWRSPEAWRWIALAHRAMNETEKEKGRRPMMNRQEDVVAETCRFSEEQVRLARELGKPDPREACPRVVREALKDTERVRVAQAEIAYQQGVLETLIGYDVWAYRGVSAEQASALREALERDGRAWLSTRPVSSWTLSKRVAENYAGRGGAVIEKYFHVSTVVHSSLSAPCLKWEKEVGVWTPWGVEVTPEEVQFLDGGAGS